jgi:parallel beta-helix repeat protein
MMKQKTLFPSCIIILVFSITVLSVPVNASTTAWTKTYGSPVNDYVVSMFETQDNGFVMGGYSKPGFETDSWIIKVDSTGNREWKQTYFNTTAFAFISTSDGGYALAGETGTFSNPQYWLVKTDAYGNPQWTKTYGGEGDERAEALIETKDGGYAIAGSSSSFRWHDRDFWLVKTDSFGNMEWNQSYGTEKHEVALSLVEASDGGYVVAGNTDSSKHPCNFLLIKTDKNGMMQWNRTYGGKEDERLSEIISTPDGGYAIAGQTQSYSSGGPDFWLLKIDKQGDVEWDKTYGGRSTEKANSLVVTSDGGYAIVGRTFSFGPGNDDFWLIKTDKNGITEWDQTYGGIHADIAESVVETSDGGYALVGTSTSFSNRSPESILYYVIWLVKTNENGEIPEFHVKIKADGTVEGTDKIQQNGNVYWITGDIFVDEFSVEKDNITLDGKGHALSGPGMYGGSTGFNLTNVNNVTIKNTNIQQFTHGIVVYNSTHITFTNNTMKNNDNCIEFTRLFNSNISGNTISNSDNGISFTTAYDNTISRNNISHNYEKGIDFFAGSHNIFSENNITANYDGFCMYGSYNTIVRNKISNNLNDGLFLLDSSQYNHIKENTIKNQTNGIRFTHSTYNKIFENNITDNEAALYFYALSSNNTFYSNNFLNNDLQVVIDLYLATQGSVNKWDNGSEGNYWSNYNGTDNNKDGIGDTPYVIDENNQDNKPKVTLYFIPEFPALATLLSLILAVMVITGIYRYNIQTKTKKSGISTIVAQTNADS